MGKRLATPGVFRLDDAKYWYCDCAMWRPLPHYPIGRERLHSHNDSATTTSVPMNSVAGGISTYTSCSKNRWMYMPSYDGVAPDEAHLTNAGYRVMARAFMAVIRQQLAEKEFSGQNRKHA